MNETGGGGFDYTSLVRSTLQGLVRDLLARAAAEGLPGEHHFYLTFGTREPGVAISPRLLRQHPEEMTIVLQHQFWNLEVGEEGFSVTLRFGGTPERLTVPFPALRAFVDPSASFGLRLVAGGPEGDAAGAARSGRDDGAVPVAQAAGAGAASPAAAKVVDFGAYRRRDDGAD